MPDRDFPVRPDLVQLKHQAKDLLKAARRSDPSAVAEFQKHHPEQIDPSRAKLADAQLVLARSYGAASWTRLVEACRLSDAIWRDDVAELRELVLKNPSLLHESTTTRDRNWGPPLTYAANLGHDQVIAALHQLGAKDHTWAMARGALQGHMDTARKLLGLGARIPPGAVMGAAELLLSSEMAALLELGASIGDSGGDWRPPVALVLETYTRNPRAKHEILEMFAERGIPLPDTPPMAMHRGRIDLLAEHLRRDAALLAWTFSHHQIWPPELGCHADEALALCGAPLGGSTLLHMCADYEEQDTACWLLDRGMDVNARAAIDSGGFGGHTALFNCIVTYNAGLRDDSMARLLLDRGADPNPRASIRKRLAFARDDSMHEYINVTALEWGAQFHDQTYVSQPAMKLIAARCGLA
jgi:Ankyrin repeat